MNIYGEATLNRCELCGIDFKSKKVKYSVDVEEHYLDLDFDEKIINFESEKAITDVISLSMEDGSNYTFYQCLIKEVSSDKCKMFFQTSLQGDYIDNINDILCMSVEFIINARPIPLIAISFLPEYSNIECANMIVKCKNNINGVLITLESKYNSLPINVFETIFFNILDITFLGNGYYLCLSTKK